MNNKKQLDKTTILSKLNDTKEIIILDEITSTNTFAKEFAKENFDEAIIIANSQTNGRGRLGRTFVSNKGTGIYISYLIRPKINLEDCKLITPLVCVAICKAIEEALLKENFKLDTKIKWVNDIYINFKKVCGILVETSTIKNNLDPEYLIIGIGLNCYEQKFPKELRNIVTTIEDESKKIISRNDLIAIIINNIDYYLNNFDQKIYMQEYINRSFIIGKKVEIKQGEKSYLAKVKSILMDGSINIEKEDKTIINISTGEITRMVIKDETKYKKNNIY